MVGIFIVIITYFLGTLPSKKEWLGVFFAAVGLIFLMLDPGAQRTNPNSEKDIVPAIVDIGSAFFGAMYFLLSAHNVKKMPICSLLLMMSVHTWIINSLIAKSVDSQIRIFSFDMEYGCLGFLNPGNDPLLISSYALLSSFFGSAGYVLCLLFYTPLVTSNAFLVEPFFAQVWGFMLGLDQMPGVTTLFATISAIVGIYYIERGSRERLESVVEDDKDGDEQRLSRVFDSTRIAMH